MTNNSGLVLVASYECIYVVFARGLDGSISIEETVLPTTSDLCDVARSE